MLESLEQLEEDIDKFHRNISDANEVYRQLRLVVKAIERYSGIFEHEAKSLRETAEKTFTDLTAQNAEQVSALAQRITAEHSKYLEDVEATRNALAENKRAIDEAYAAFLKWLEDCKEDDNAKLGRLEQQVESMAAAAEHSCIRISEEMDQLQKRFLEMQQSVNKKLTWVIVGLGLSVVLLALSFAVK